MKLSTVLCNKTWGRGWKEVLKLLEGFKIGDCKTYAYTKVQTDIQIIEMLLNTKSVEDCHILCQHQEIVITPGANVKLINKYDDEKAGVTICDRGCKINETKSVINAQCESKSVDPTAPKSIKPTPSNETIEIKENDNDNVSLIAGIFSGAMVVIIIIIIAQ